MNSLLVVPELYRADGGIARMLRLYLRVLAGLASPAGHVDCVALNDVAAPDPRMMTVGGRLGTWAGCDRQRTAFVGKTLRLARRTDLLVCGHLHHLPIAWLAQWVNPRLRYVLVAHGIEVWRPYGIAERRALLGAHRILCVSDHTRRQMLRFLPSLSADRLRVVPNSWEPPAGSTAAAPDRTTAHPMAGGPVILSVGRLDPADAYKGFDLLIEALPLVRREIPAARLRIVGHGGDRERLAALAVRRGVADAVDFLGAVPDAALQDEYAGCAVFALPSRREGFGIVFLEAMAHGKGCVGARAGGAPEVISPETGELVEYGNIDALAFAFVDLIRHPLDSAVVRHRAESFAFPAFERRLTAALA